MAATAKQKSIVPIFIGFAVGLVIGGVIGYFAALSGQPKDGPINSYDECVAAGYPIMESYPARCSVPGGKSFTQDTTATFEGKIVCLPHKRTDGPQTLECATGLLTDDGKYYALHIEHPSSLASQAGNDKRVRITGTLSQEADDKYQNEGTIQVKSYELL